MSDRAEEPIVLLESFDQVVDLVEERRKRAVTARLESAGKPYRPSNGSEGVEFEDAVCGTCDHYRPMVEDPGIFDCTLGLILAAHMADGIKDPVHPKEWVYNKNGRPTCTAWIRRTAGADVVPPTLCGGARTPEEELKAYRKAMGWETTE